MKKVLTGLLLLLPGVAFAQSTPFDNVNAKPSKLGTAELGVTIGRILDVALGFLGLVAFFIVLMGGFKWMTSAGASDKIDEAKKMIGAGVIGMALILAAWAISRFIVNSLYNATSA